MRAWWISKQVPLGFDTHFFPKIYFTCFFPSLNYDSSYSFHAKFIRILGYHYYTSAFICYGLLLHYLMTATCFVSFYFLMFLSNSFNCLLCPMIVKTDFRAEPSDSVICKLTPFLYFNLLICPVGYCSLLIFRSLCAFE